MLIREAISADAPDVASLYRELVSDPNLCVLPEQVETLRQSASSFLLVAEIHGVICGTALLNLCADVMYGAQPFGVIENVIISPSFRGQGVGRQLMSHMEHLAIQNDCTKLMLLSSQTRTEAHAFFRRCGFHDGTKQGFVKYRRQFDARPSSADD
ncbi:GNAT family N-acetyltransferase [Verrucomicrobium sp. BvORR034]|uniref:GNAT family N-acetyltransferase n=1 Tax=Verrucomicrobium sp. BvORR034 TaxID=1396418 RepID=UPI000678BA4D|nr:GNAT family N-acetyltransferase [Verrucomicrobium sp. BvORR034]